jgi:hypothetical protein
MIRLRNAGTLRLVQLFAETKKYLNLGTRKEFHLRYDKPLGGLHTEVLFCGQPLSLLKPEGSEMNYLADCY